MTIPEERFLARILCPPSRPTLWIMWLLLTLRAGKTYDRMEAWVATRSERELKARRSRRTT